MDSAFLIIGIGIASIFALWMTFYFIPIGLWFTALVSGIEISLLELVLMRWRKVPPTLIVNALIASSKGGVKLERDDLEALYLAGGNIDNVTKGMIYAKANGIELSFKVASSLELAQKNIIEELEKFKQKKLRTTTNIMHTAVK